MFKLKITSGLSMTKVLESAAKRAKVGPRLAEHTGERCLYGEAFHMIGLPDTAMLNGKKDLPLWGLFILPGASQWDQGDKRTALDIATKSWGGLTVGQARNVLRQNGAKLIPLRAL